MSKVSLHRELNPEPLGQFVKPAKAQQVYNHPHDAVYSLFLYFASSCRDTQLYIVGGELNPKPLDQESN